MNVQILAYMEDDALSFGIRSEEKFEGATHDGAWWFRYGTVEETKTKILGIKIKPTTDGYEIKHKGEILDFVPLDGSHTASFEITI